MIRLIHISRNWHRHDILCGIEGALVGRTQPNGYVTFEGRKDVAHYGTPCEACILLAFNLDAND